MSHEAPQWTDHFSDSYAPPTEGTTPATARSRFLETLLNPEFQAKAMDIAKNVGHAGLEGSGVVKVSKRTGKTKFSPVGAVRLVANPWNAARKGGMGMASEARGTIRRDAVNQARTALGNLRQQPAESDPFASLTGAANPAELPAPSTVEARGYLGFGEEPTTDLYADLFPGQPVDQSRLAAEKPGRFGWLRRNNPTPEQPIAPQTWKGFDDEPSTLPQAPPEGFGDQLPPLPPTDLFR